MKNGLYSVRFAAQGGAGAGVVVLQDGQLRGGDSGSYYRGTYSAEDGSFSANIAIRTHTMTSSLGFVFGEDGTDMTLVGTSTQTTAEVEGTSPKFPGVVFSCRLARVAD